MTSASSSNDGHWNGNHSNDHNGDGHLQSTNNGLMNGNDMNNTDDNAQTSTSWFSGLDDEDNLLDYFLGGVDHGGGLPPTPEGEPLSNESAAIVSSSVPLQLAQSNDGINDLNFVHQQQQQQQQQIHNDLEKPQSQPYAPDSVKQRNHIRFSLDSDSSSAFGPINTKNGHMPSSVHDFQPPPTPAVQHFYSRSSSSASNPTSNGVMTNINPFHPQPTSSSNIPSTTQIFNKPVSMLYTASQHSKNHNHSPLMFQSNTNSTSPILPVNMHNPFHASNQQQPSTSAQPHLTSVPSSSIPLSQQPGTIHSLSPISPAALCTSEVMIFPPPHTSGYVNVHTNNSTSTLSTVSQHNNNSNNNILPISTSSNRNGTATNNNIVAATQRQWEQIHPSPPLVQPSANHESSLSHTSWLQHVNNMAMNATATNSTSTLPTKSQHHQQQQGQQTNQQSAFYTTASNDANQQQPTYSNIMSHPQHHNTRHTTDILPLQPTSSAAAAAALHHFNSLSNSNTSSNPVVESKEKREKRLARNRESARQSRRRKKELLINLEAQVNKLHLEIETERRRQLLSMEKDMIVIKDELLKELFRTYRDGSSNQQRVDDVFNLVIRDAGPNVNTRRAAAEFQYNALRQLILPCYQRFFLAESLREETFFTKAKEIKSKENKGTGRISSKLVGDEITKSYSKEKSSLSCSVDDSDKVWPLLCYELTVSLDQEERLLQAFKKLRDDSTMPQNRSKLSLAVNMASTLRNGVLYQSHAASHHNEIALMQVLTQSQAIAFLEWFQLNKERCSKLFGLENNIVFKQSENKSDDSGNGFEYNISISQNGTERSETLKASDSLNDICNQLNKALKIVKNEL